MENPATLKVRKNPICGDKKDSHSSGLTARCFYISKGVRRSPLQSNQCYQMYKFHELLHREG